MKFFKNLFWLLFSFRGRMSRKGSSLSLLFQVPLTAYCFSLYREIEEGEPLLQHPLFLVVAAILAWMTLAAVAKRLHDYGYYGWWVLFMLPLVYFASGTGAAVLLLLLFTGPVDGENEHGMPSKLLFPPRNVKLDKLKAVSAKLEALDKKRSQGHMTADEHEAACKALLEAE